MESIDSIILCSDLFWSFSWNIKNGECALMDIVFVLVLIRDECKSLLISRRIVFPFPPDFTFFSLSFRNNEKIIRTTRFYFRRFWSFNAKMKNKQTRQVNIKWIYGYLNFFGQFSHALWNVVVCGWNGKWGNKAIDLQAIILIWIFPLRVWH